MRKRKNGKQPESGYWDFRYERTDGTNHFRSISVRAESQEAAQEIADRRHSEQFGPFPRQEEKHILDGDGNHIIDADGVPAVESFTVFDVPPRHKGEDRLDLLSTNYELVNVTKLK